MDNFNAHLIDLMKQTSILLFFFAGITAGARAQNTAGLNIAVSSPVLSLSDSTTTAIPSTAKLLEDILNVTGLKSNFTLKEADVLNIEASISRKQRYILYNPSFINQINTIT